MIPNTNELTICFAHVAYQLGPQFAKRNRGIRFVQASSREHLDSCIGEADVLVISGLWRNDLLDRAGKLRFIQSIGAGTDQFPRGLLTKRGIRLASARGVNARAVSEHAMALILALARKLPEARDNQSRRHWRGMISSNESREDELFGKTVLVVGLGAIGNRLARLAKTFEMRVCGFRKTVALGKGDADSVHAMHELKDLVPDADYLVLSCPLTDETRNLIDRDLLARMKASAFLVNVARGACVDEASLVEALGRAAIAGAAIDVTAEEPLSAGSPLWSLPNILITPHTAGETRRYEDNVLDILEENLGRLWSGRPDLHNQIV
jgi:phosphoglycerate dehydrogenase-like enzyme